MKYFFFDVRSVELHTPAEEAAVIICDRDRKTLEAYHFKGVGFEEQFADVFVRGHYLLVCDRPYPRITNFLNMLIDEEYIENVPYLLIDLASILHERKSNPRRPKADDILVELEEVKSIFFGGRNANLDQNP